MAGFFDSDSEDEPSLPPIPPPLHGAGTAGAAGPSRRSDARSSSNSGHAFRQRLESTLSPSSRSSAGIRVAGTNTDSYAGAGDGGEGYDASVRGSSAFEGTGGGAGHGAGTGRGGSRAYSIGDVDMDGGTDDKSTPREPGRGRRDQGRILRSESGMDLDRDEDNGGDEVLEGMLGDEGDEGDDVRRLSRAWVKERGTQAIMQWEGELMDELFDKLEQQQKMVDLLKSDPKTSEEEHFKLMLVMTEMERVKYLVRSYVRTRLAKIERFSYHITLTPELHPLLSGAELSHAQRYTDLLHTHYKSSVLDSLPEWLRNMDDKTSGSTDMVPRPNPDLPVLIYCRRDCGEIDLRLRPDGDVPFLAKGSTHLVKYRLVERWIQLGWAEVL